MPWTLGSFLVTPCALTSCHVVISKQDSTIRALRLNWYVTGRYENHAVRIGQSAEKHGVQALAPPGSWKKIWKEVLSLSIYVSPSISQLTSVTFRSLVKQTATRNLYITIYIYFLDGRLCEVGAVRREIRIIRL